MLFYLKYVLHVLVLPPMSLLCLAGLGLALGRRRPALGRTLVAVALTLLWLVSTPIVSLYLARRVEPYPALDLSRPTHAQALVILGGGAVLHAPEYDGAAAPLPITLQRVAYGAYAARRLGLPVLVTGAATEAAAMHDSLQRLFGIETRWTDATARDTYDNARHSAALLRADGISSIVLVTTSNHMRRAVHEFEDAGLAVTAAPTGLELPSADPLEGLPLGLIPKTSGLDRSEAALREFIGEAARPGVQALHRWWPGG